ncbi:MAG: hypothetical protein COY58_05990 [Gammaproteobacteria bacterium CG_4_10_14_0_8_um_filter_38_16]|nr:MAG: hypothetical protein COY58_05990 [Gammaproteobacteria bacterium CG_4_10_14_0_8_um_filter_38_16]
MANAAYIQGKIYYGYGKAAKHLGLDSDFYRSATPFNPIVVGNKIGTIKVSLNQTWDYMKANRYGNAVWQMLGDARQPPDSIGFNVWDYFQFTDLEGKLLTFFVIGKQLILPILAVECNRVVKIERATQDVGPGFNNEYAGYTTTPSVPRKSITLAENLPISILNQGIGRKNDLNLPTDTMLPRFIILMPNLGGVIYKNRDIIIDDNNYRYVIVSSELTDFGWRCNAEFIGT